MATEAHPNGNYLPQQHHQTYSGGVMPSHPQSHPAPSGPAPDAFGSQGANVPSSQSGTTSTANNGGSATNEVPKDEVGWYFVEQYYTNLSKSPERLHVS